MANDKVTIWNQTIKLGRPPANGELLIGNGADFNLAALTAGSNVTITNSAGGISIASTNPGGTVTGVTATSPLASTGGTAPVISLSGTVGVANGGTGATTLTSNNVLLGNGTSAVQFVAPGASGNILTSNGTTWAGAPNPFVTTLFLESDFTITNQGAAQDITGLSFYMDESATYSFQSVLYLSCGAGGAVIEFAGPSPTPALSLARTVYGTPAIEGMSLFNFSDPYYTTGAATSVIAMVSIIGTIINNSSSGNLKLTLKQFTSNAAATTIKKGAWIQYKKA